MAEAYAPYQQQQQQQQSSAYRHPDPKISGHRDELAPPPPRHAAQKHATGNAPYDPTYFPPPPRSERGYDYDDAGARPTASYAGSEARDDDGQAIAPYDEEKAYAQYSDAYGPPDYGGQRPAPPPSDYDRRHDERRHDDRPRRDEQRERRRNSRPPPSDYDYDDDYDRRRRNSRPPASHADDDDRKRKDKRTPIERGKDLLRSAGGGDGERGLGATLLGGAAGAFIGDQVGSKGKGKHGKDSALGTLGGALVGAIGAHAAERQWEKREKSKEEHERSRGGVEERNKVARRSYMDEHAAGGDDFYAGSRGQSREESGRGGGAAARDEFRPRRAGQRGAGAPRRRRGRGESSDSYTSDE
ncbi:hypothetical protein LTR36_007796 [Oleoguttula mirabilis]|uniref:Glycine zipper 2TM domain-containing protein n=1 Tax=Oleoguttula mirabilis TaxID=1507867 RepID=A0AAV9J9Q8_9PEZI|nr:hypothetical protein LTR36_007796 [Oleoguttula mirabilis]